LQSIWADSALFQLQLYALLQYNWI